MTEHVGGWEVVWRGLGGGGVRSFQSYLVAADMSLLEEKSIRLDESYACVGVCGSLYNRAKLDHVAQKEGKKRTFQFQMMRGGGYVAGFQI